MKKKPIKITAEELDRKFDNNEEILQYFDTKNGKMVPPAIQRIN